MIQRGKLEDKMGIRPIYVIDFEEGRKYVDEDGDLIPTHLIKLVNWDDEETMLERMTDKFRDYVGDTLSDINDVRIAISDRLSPWNYFNVRNDDWELRVIDSYVDDALLHGDYDFVDENIAPTKYLDAEIQHLVGLCEYRDEYWNKVAKLIENYDFDGALKMLQ